MTTTGPNYSSTVANYGTGTAWTNPTNAQGSSAYGGSSYATCDIHLTTSQYLLFTNYGFSVPGIDSVTGVFVEVNTGLVGAMGEATVEAQLYLGGSLIGTPKTYAGWGVFSIGGSSDMWGVSSISSSDANSSTFGVAIRAIGTDDGPGIIFYGARMTLDSMFGDAYDSPGSSTSGHFLFNWI